MVVQVMGLHLPECRRQVGWRTAGQAMALRDQGREVLAIPGPAVLAAHPRLDPVSCHRRISRCRRKVSLDPMVSPLRIRLVPRIRSRGMVRGSRECSIRALPGQGRNRLRRMTIVVSPRPNRASA